MFEDFSPPEAVKLLKENTLKLENITNKIIAKRNEYALAEAEYLDAENYSRTKRMVEMGVTLAKEFMKSDTHEAKKKLLKITHELKNLTDIRDVMESGNNNLKVQIKLAEAEMRNLNMQ